jgi:predicted cupin superfamily sugar epimerase
MPVDDPLPGSPDDPATGVRIAAALGLAPLDSEGGLFRRTYSSDGVTAILYLVARPDFSAMHRLRASDELYFFHAGAPLRLLVLAAAGEGGAGVQSRDVLLGPDPLAGQHPQLSVPAGAWQGSSSTSGWSLVSTVVAPGFQWHDFELGDRRGLTDRFPDFTARIAELTR